MMNIVIWNTGLGIAVDIMEKSNDIVFNNNDLTVSSSLGT